MTNILGLVNLYNITKGFFMKLFKLTAAIVLIFTVIISLTISSHASEAVDGAKKDYDNFKTEMSAKLPPGRSPA